MSNGPNSYQLDDVMYYLTRLEGQLVRLNELKGGCSNEVIRTVDSARAFAQSLRDALSGNRIDVI